MLDLELHPVLCIDQPLAVAVHGGVGHGAQVDPEAELAGGEILGQGHVWPAASGWLPSLVRVPLWPEVTGEFLPHVAAVDTFVVNPVGHAVDRNFNLGYVGVEVVFGVPGPGCVGVDEDEQNALERPALWVHPQIQPGFRASVKGLHHFAHDEVLRELLAAGICALRLVGQEFAANYLVLNLDVFQLVHELGAVWPLHDFVCGSEGQVGKYWVVQVDAVLGAVDSIEGVFFIHARGLLVTRARANLVQIRALDAFAQHVCPFIC